MHTELSIHLVSVPERRVCYSIAALAATHRCKSRTRHSRSDRFAVQSRCSSAKRQTVSHPSHHRHLLRIPFLWRRGQQLERARALSFCRERPSHMTITFISPTCREDSGKCRSSKSEYTNQEIFAFEGLCSLKATAIFFH